MNINESWHDDAPTECLPGNGAQRFVVTNGVLATSGIPGEMRKGFLFLPRVPTRTGKWEGIFQSGKKSRKITQNTGKFREFSEKCYLLFLVIFK